MRLRGAGRGAVGGASGAGVGRDPVFGAVCLGRAEKGGVFIPDAELSVVA